MKLFNNIIKKGATLEMIYISANGKMTQRFIRVIKIQKDGMLAYCYYRKQVRMFKFQNILSVQRISRRLSV